MEPGGGGDAGGCRAMRPLRRWGAAAVAAALLSGACGVRALPPDVLLVTVDTLRADALGCYGRAEARTPNLDRLASEGARFAQAFAPRGETLPSLTTILTGVSPLTHGVLSNGYALAPGIPTLAEALGNAGYRTGAFLANQCAPLVETPGQAGDGFDTRECAQIPEARQWAWDREATRRAREWLRAEPHRPAFCWVHLMDPHAPHDPPPELVRGTWLPELRPDRQASTLRGIQFSGRQASPAVVGGLWRLYDAEVAGSDAFVGELVEAVRARRATPPIVIVAGDHGEEFFEHADYYGHSESMHDVVLRVPLLVVMPGRVPAGAVPQAFAELEDVLPTVLEGVGLPPAPGVEGRSLLEGGPRFSVGTWRRTVLTARTPRYRYLWNRGGAGGKEGKTAAGEGPGGEARVEDVDAAVAGARRFPFDYFRRTEVLYDLSRDPEESADRLRDDSWRQDPEIRAARRELRDRLERWLAAHPPGPVAPHRLGDERVGEELRRLGYVGGD